MEKIFPAKLCEWTKKLRSSSDSYNSLSTSDDEKPGMIKFRLFKIQPIMTVDNWTSITELHPKPCKDDAVLMFYAWLLCPRGKYTSLLTYKIKWSFGQTVSNNFVQMPRSWIWTDRSLRLFFTVVWTMWTVTWWKKYELLSMNDFSRSMTPSAILSADKTPQASLFKLSQFRFKIYTRKFGIHNDYTGRLIKPFLNSTSSLVEGSRLGLRLF